MNQDKDEAAREFMKEVVDDLGYTPKGEKNEHPKRSVHLKPGSRFLIPGMILLILIVIIAFFFTGRTDSYKEDLTAIKSGLDRLEKDLARLDGLEERMVRLENQEKKLRQSVKRIAARSSKSYKKKSSTIKKRYYTVQTGDSLYNIAKKYGTSTDKLCKINKITDKKPLQPGQKLLISR